MNRCFLSNHPFKVASCLAQFLLRNQFTGAKPNICESFTLASFLVWEIVFFVIEVVAVVIGQTLEVRFDAEYCALRSLKELSGSDV